MRWLRSARISISEIFATEGEATFRQLERETLAELETRTGQSLPPAAGAIVDPENLASLKRHAWWCASGPAPKPSTSAPSIKATGRCYRATIRWAPSAGCWPSGACLQTELM